MGKKLGKVLLTRKVFNNNEIRPFSFWKILGSFTPFKYLWLETMDISIQKSDVITRRRRSSLMS